MAIKVCDWSEAISRAVDWPPTALTVGSFDGPHVGHRAIFHCVVQEAEERGLVPAVVTFRRPLGVLREEKAATPHHCEGTERSNLSTLDERLECFEKCGIKMAVVVDFSADFARITGGEFFDLLREKLTCRFVAEGEDFHCGYGGAWGRREIAAYCAEHDIGCTFVPPVMMGGHRVSSSRIRAAIAAGDMEAARMMLG